MGEASPSSSFIPPTAAVSPYPLGPSGIPLIPCPKCGDEVVECKSRKNNDSIFFKCVNYDDFAAVKCQFFRWLEGYKKVVEKKLKEEDLQAAASSDGRGGGRTGKSVLPDATSCGTGGGSVDPLVRAVMMVKADGDAGLASADILQLAMAKGPMFEWPSYWPEEGFRKEDHPY